MTEEDIRRRAYAIWEREGRPEGRAEAHWRMAREELAIRENTGLTTHPTSNAEDGRPGPRAEPFEVEPPEDETEGSMPDLRGEGPYPKHRRRSSGKPPGSAAR